MLVTLSKLQQMTAELRNATDIPFELKYYGPDVQLGYQTVTGLWKALTSTVSVQTLAHIILTELNMIYCRDSAQTDRDYVPANREMTWLPSRLFEPKLIAKESLAI